MKSSALCGVAAACLVAVAGAAQADEKPGSVYVQCDGKPEIQSLGKTSAQLLGIMLTAGIVGGMVGGPEAADAGKLLDGQRGVDACEAALGQNKNETRAIELKLAKAIHEIELAKYDAAIADTTSLAAVAPSLQGESTYQHGLALGAMEIQAAALTRQGKAAEAEALALKMAAVQPYDLLSHLRAQTYVGLTGEMTPAKRTYFEEFSRIYPPSLVRRSVADEWAGDFAGAAQHVADYIATIHGFQEDPDKPPSSLLLAHQAVSTLLAGDVAGSNALADRAKASIERELRDGTSSQIVTESQELIDFQAVGRQLAEGHATEARAAFAGRSRWFAPSPPAVAEMASRLRAGAPAAQLTGALAVEPAKIRADALARQVDAVASIKPIGPSLFKAVRVQGGDPYGGGLTRSVWRVDKSSIVVQRRPNSKYVGEGLALTYYNDGVAAGEALLLHAALRARAEGKTGFVLAPARQNIGLVLVRYGNPGETDFPKSSTFVAQKVIDDLSAVMPDPSVKR